MASLTFVLFNPPARNNGIEISSLIILLNSQLWTLFFTKVRHVYDYRKLKLNVQQLRIEKQQAELNYLKSKINPNFLFNTLSNIYSLARDGSKLVPEAIVLLSKILRFMLYR